MANLRPKLSSSKAREIAIRKQLGIAPHGTAKTRGRLGAERARKEYERREKMKRRRYPRFENLSFDLQNLVFSYLSLSDLDSARKAGLASVSVASHHNLQNMMRHRCQKLRPIWSNWRTGTPGYDAAYARHACMPIQFSEVKILRISSSGGYLSPGIGEMRALRNLDISRIPQNEFDAAQPPLSRLPRSLARCQNLRCVKLAYHHFEEIPECLLRLTNLNRLFLRHNSHLKSIPENIGDRLPKLATLNILECKKIQSLPKSLLQRLEKNRTGQNRFRIPLAVTAKYFKDKYLDNIIKKEEYPELSRYHKRGLLAF